MDIVASILRVACGAPFEAPLILRYPFVGFRSNLEEVSRFAIETTEKKGRARKLAWHR